MNNVARYEGILETAEAMRFTHYHRIALAAQKDAFRKLNPNLKKMLWVHPESEWRTMMVPPKGLLNKYKVPPRDPAHRRAMIDAGWSEITYPVTRYQNIKGGEILVEGNSLKLILTHLDPDRNTRKQVREVIRYLIEKRYICAKNTKPHVLRYYLKKFHFNEVELNAYYDDPALFGVLKDHYSYLDEGETMNLLYDFGYRMRPESFWRSIYSHMKLNSWDSSAYCWANDSTKLFTYNTTAEKEDRSYNLPGDRYKVELCLKRMYFKDTKKPLDFSLITNMEGSGIYRKAWDAVTAPVRAELTHHRIIQVMHEKRKKILELRNF